MKKTCWRSQKRGRACRTVREGNLKWILKQFVWFCCVAETLERAFPSVLLSPCQCLPAWSACHIWVVAMGLVHWGPVIDHREQGPIINHTDEQHAPQEPLSNDGQRCKFFWHGFFFFFFFLHAGNSSVIVITPQIGNLIALWWHDAKITEGLSVELQL